MTGFVDGIRRSAEAGRRAAEPFVRPTTVTIVVEQWSGPVGAVSSTLTSTTNTVISPRPKVEATGAGAVSAYGGGYGSASAGGLVAGEYTIGPITLNHSAGGYSVQDLLPVGALDKTVSVLLAGDGFIGTGEYFEVIPESVETTAYHVNFRVKRVQQ